MRTLFKYAVLFAMALTVNVGLADDYKLQVSRAGSNIYKVYLKDIYIITKYCYEYAYYEEAYLRMNGYSGKIIFLEGDEACDVKAVYGKTDMNSGTYSVTVSSLDDGWYEVDGTNLLIKAEACSAYSYMDEAVLKLSYGGHGMLYFDDGDECTVEGVYSKMRL